MSILKPLMKFYPKYLIAILLFCGFVDASDFGIIKGIITDSLSSNPLPYANIFLSNTSMGSTSDEDGEYVITDIPAGPYELTISYIGYQQQNISVNINGGDELIKNINLIPQTVQAEAVLVTVQAKGQKSAINQQLSSKSIMNAVSSARIEALPDANAAESVGRLPGVSVTRVGGEGTKVVIRGVAPKYNVITIDGIRLASSEAGDRSTDLSMISSSMLEGIEVFKTVTADKDADALGGTVNFKLRKAKKGFKLSLQYENRNAEFAGSRDKDYFSRNILGNTILNTAELMGLDKDSEYKIIPSIEARLFKNRLGIFMQTSIDRKNLTSHEFAANYDNKTNDDSTYITQSIGLSHLPRDKERKNRAIIIDYKLSDGSISFANFSSSGFTEQFRRSERYDIGSNAHFYEIGNSSSEQDITNNILSIEKQFSRFHIETKYSQSFSKKNNPGDWSINFYRIPAGINSFYNASNINPSAVLDSVILNPSKTNLNTASRNINYADEKSYMASIDLTVPVNIGNRISAEFKFGGKSRIMTRHYESDFYGSGAPFISPSSRVAANMIIEDLGRPFNPWNYNIPLSWFVDTTYSYNDFMDGDYPMHSPISYELAEQVADFCQANVKVFKSSGAGEAYARNNYLSKTNDYSGEETLSASYLMATIKFGPKLTIIPGVRYQNLKTSYSGIRGQQSALSYYSYDHSDTTTKVNHTHWLPNFNLKFKPVNWFDVRFAYSNTISYPDYNTIIPRIDVTTGGALSWNNYELKASRSKNYDLYFSFYDKKIGLFTVGGFLKQIEDLIYAWSFSKAGLEAKPYYLTDREPAAQLNYNISTYVNNPFIVQDLGFEIDWQTHFWYLPKPLNGFILNMNYTHINSEAEYPFVYAGATSATDVDTSFVDRLIYQPNHIFNLSIGYDYKDFSILLSVLYQDDIFSGVSHWPQLRTTTAAYKRWDVSFKQGLPWSKSELYGSINNLNNEKDSNVLQMYQNIPRYLEAYGTSAELGIRIKI